MEPQFNAAEFINANLQKLFEPKENKHRLRKFTHQEVEAEFGKVEGAKINFVPQMLHALLMQKCIDFINFCIEHRLREFIKHTRLMKNCIEEHVNVLRQVYGYKYFKAYTTYVKRYNDVVYTDIWLFQKGLEEASANQLPNKRYQEVAAMLTFIILLRKFAEEYDRQMDILIAKRLNTPSSQHQEPYMVFIEALVVDIAETFNYKLEITQDMRLWVKILSNKAIKLCEEIFAKNEIDELDTN